jgi:MoaA/NifB/PqqE/SkfB family radical SAM enzyme
MGIFTANLEASIGSIVRKVISPQSGAYKKLQVLYRSLLYMKRMRKLKLLKFGIILADHCNLNCAGCSSYSPLAKENFYDIDTFRDDCKRISGLTNRKVASIGFAGGEPLLHPRITDFFDTARSFFDKSEGMGGIILFSNGILLPKQPDSFWENCRKNDVEIWVTKYPINIDFEAIDRTVKNYGIKFSYYYKTDKTPKRTNILALDLNGKQNIKKAFRTCIEKNECIALRNGRLYTCTRRSIFPNFNSYFKTGVEESDTDSIDIYKAKDIDEILDFLRRPIPFCRYCDWENTEMYKMQWHTSKKEISEWTV